MKHILARVALSAAILCAWVSPAAAQIVTLPQVNNAGGSKVPTQGVVCVNVDGTACAFGGGSGGTASAENQTTQISAEQAIRDQIGGISVSPNANTLQARLAAIVSALGSPLQAGGSVQGSSASGATDAGSPVKVGCRYNSTLPTFTDGQRGDCQITARGDLMVGMSSGISLGQSVTSGAGLMKGSDGTARLLGMIPHLYTGSSNVPAPGDTTGAYVVQKGGANLATNQVSVGTSATLVAAARTGRQRITVNVGAANTCAFGASGVTATTGFPLQPVAGTSLTLDTNAAVYAVCSAATTVGFIEQY